MVSHEKPGYNVMNQEIKKYLAEDKRLDGRKPFEIRTPEVTLNISKETSLCILHIPIKVLIPQTLSHHHS